MPKKRKKKRKELSKGTVVPCHQIIDSINQSNQVKFVKEEVCDEGNIREFLANVADL